jgi:hypothetical protein
VSRPRKLRLRPCEQLIELGGSCNECFATSPIDFVGGLDCKGPAEFSSTASGSTPICTAGFLSSYGPPGDPFTPPRPYGLDEFSFWLGTEKVWTVLRKSGIWEWAPHPPGHKDQVQRLTEKTLWMSADFSWDREWRPKLRVTGRRLDGDAPPLRTLPPTNAFPCPTVAMLSGVYVPTPGCWEITGDYKGQKLSFVAWVRPVKQGNQ